jgi:hypothetical protein
MKKVENQDRRFGSAREYILIQHRGKSLLFTEHQVRMARARAKANPEDIPGKTSLPRRLLRRLWRMVWR